jgi:hypothetical protein
MVAPPELLALFTEGTTIAQQGEGDGGDRKAHT